MTRASYSLPPRRVTDIINHFKTFFMRKKNAFTVQDFKDWINTQLKEAPDNASDEFKKGLCAALEHVLTTCKWDIEFVYTYWTEQGLIEFQQAGCPKGENTKQQFVLGPSGQEYNRQYQ
jgi:hypothetical protein